MKIKIDADACIGCGLCVNTCPDVYKMEGDKAVLAITAIPANLEADAKKGAEECPVTAITVE